MAKTKSVPRYNVGDEIRVRSGVSDPDYDDLTIGGWAGIIAEVQSGTPPTFLVRWSNETLKNQSSIYRKRCERDGFDSNKMWLEECDLESDEGEPVQIEQPTSIVTKPLSMDDQDDRIRTVFGLTSDDPLPEVNFESLMAFHEYLAANLSFPFEAEWTTETGLFEATHHRIMVTGLGEPEEPWIDEMYGLICKARGSRQSFDIPLSKLKFKKRDRNRQLISDFSYWFLNWG